MPDQLSAVRNALEIISRDLLAPRARRLFPSGCRGVRTYQEADTEVMVGDKQDRSIGSVANHKQHILASMSPFCIT